MTECARLGAGRSLAWAARDRRPGRSAGSGSAYAWAWHPLVQHQHQLLHLRSVTLPPHLPPTDVFSSTTDHTPFPFFIHRPFRYSCPVPAPFTLVTPTLRAQTPLPHPTSKRSMPTTPAQSNRSSPSPLGNTSAVQTQNNEVRQRPTHRPREGSRSRNIEDVYDAK